MKGSAAWFGHRGSDTVMLTALDPVSISGAFLYGSAQGTRASSPWSRCLEASTGRESVSSDDLESRTLDLIRDGFSTRRPSRVIPFRSTRRLERWASINGVLVESAQAALVTEVADRRFLTEYASKRGVKVPEAVQVSTRMGYADLRAEMGSEFIVKGVSGVSGRDCYLVGGEADLAAVRAATGSRELYAWRIVEGRSYNYHFCVGNSWTTVFEPTMQRLAPADRLRPYCFAGNTYKSTEGAPAELSGADREIHALARVLRDVGFRGVAGADVVVSGHEHYIVDLNPRFQGSSLILDLNLAASSMPRLVDQHVMAVSGGELHREVTSPLGSPQAVGGQVFVFAKQDGASEARGYLNGVYSRGGRGLRYEGKYRVGEKLSDGCFLVLDMPTHPLNIAPGAVFARVIHAPGATSTEITNAVRCISERRFL